jgi:hypothetical protein
MKANAQKEVGEVKRFTGLCPFRIMAVNPTKEELETLTGISFQNDIVYSGDKDGVATMRLDFWMNNPEATYVDEKGVEQNINLWRKFSIFIENNKSTSKNGNKRIVNDLLQATWASDVQAVADNENMSWFSQNHNSREAYVGEVELLEFFKKLLGLSSGSTFKGILPDEVKLSTPWSKLINGDVKELRGYINEANAVGNGLTFLLGVKITDDGKMYDDVYNKYYQASKNKKTEGFTKSLTDEYGEFKSDYQNSLKFQLYTGTAPLIAPSSAPAPVAAKSSTPF